MADTDRGTPAARRRKLFMYADQLRLDRADRHSIAETLLWRDVASWKDLSDAEIDRLLDAFEGYLLINHLLADR